MIVINPIMGGGLSLAKLQAATAAPEDVLAGKKFYSGSKELQIGTRSAGTLRAVSGTFAFPTTTSYITTGFYPQYIVLWVSSGALGFVYFHYNLYGGSPSYGVAYYSSRGYSCNSAISVTSTGFNANTRLGSTSLSDYFKDSTVNYVAFG